MEGGRPDKRGSWHDADQFDMRDIPPFLLISLPHALVVGLLVRFLGSFVGIGFELASAITLAIVLSFILALPKEAIRRPTLPVRALTAFMWLAVLALGIALGRGWIPQPEDWLR